MSAAVRWRLSLLAALSCALPGGGPPAGALAQETPGGEPPVFGVQATGVVVDVVVRDRKGRLVRDLQASDFEVYEDGEKQAIASFRVYDSRRPEEAASRPAAPAPVAETTAGQAAAPAEAPQENAPSVIAFVFDRLSAEARRIARNAALAYTESGYVSGDLVGVFSIDLALRTLQPFTNDPASIRHGLDRAVLQANTAFASDREEIGSRIDAVDRADDTLDALGGSGGADPGTAALVASQQAFDRMQATMLRSFEAMERDQQGFATTHGLLAVVNGLKRLPGRKTIVFFSEGIAIPANVQAQFQSVIASANRSNVSIYTMDAAGLRTDSGTHEAAEEMRRGAQRRLRQEESTGLGVPTREAMTRQLERNEDMLRLNPESGLGRLADETGGFAVRDTNDARSGFGRIAEEMRFHYLLSYAPTNERLDGRFRTINVKVGRPDVRVQSRKGYFAVRPEYVVPVRAYEAPALAQLERTPPPHAFPLGVAALSFPEPDRPGLVPVLVSVPGQGVSWAPDPSSGFHAAFTVLVRIKDERGREADRLSQDYRLSTPADKIDSARRGDILFYREANLPAGRYTAEAVAYDALAGTASVRAAPLEVPPAGGDRLRLSSLVLVDRAEELTAEEQKDGKNPLHFGPAILYPNLGTPFRKAALPAMGFYFSVYGGGTQARPTATIELRQGDRTLASLPAELPAPDGNGRIQYAGALPLKNVPAGEFVLRVSVSDGAANDARQTPFTVE
jgi:VWFA-related protein